MRIIKHPAKKMVSVKMYIGNNINLGTPPTAIAVFAKQNLTC